MRKSKGCTLLFAALGALMMTAMPALALDTREPTLMAQIEQDAPALLQTPVTADAIHAVERFKRPADTGLLAWACCHPRPKHSAPAAYAGVSGGGADPVTRPGEEYDGF